MPDGGTNSGGVGSGGGGVGGVGSDSGSSEFGASGASDKRDLRQSRAQSRASSDPAPNWPHLTFDFAFFSGAPSEKTGCLDSPLLQADATALVLSL